MRFTRREVIGTVLRALGATKLAVLLKPASAMAAPSLGGGTQNLEPMEIDFPAEAIADLNRRLEATRWPEMPFDTDWTAGTNVDILRELVRYWREDYDWFAVQRDMNRLEHLLGPVGGEALHCVRYVASDRRRDFPILLLHGWPGSFWEFHHAAARLVAGVDGMGGFDLVVPSLPGFAFSDAPREPGMTPARVASRLHLLMGELGHERYGVQGGDWGAIIGTELARQQPEAVVGLHLNFVASAPPPPQGVAPSPEEEAYRARRGRFQAEETGYSSIQGTRPQSLALAQHDSPAGWLAWMLEKYWAWSDHGGDLWRTFSRDDILTTAMLYWVPGRILSAARIYYETTNRSRDSPPRSGRVAVPTGYSRFPAEPWAPPREVVERTYDLVYYSEPPRGGHFPALEQPEIWAREVATFFGGHV
jgi:epoxide hydrolase